MLLYLAAPWIDKHLMPDRAKKFEEVGHTISWKWWDTEDLPIDERSLPYLKDQAAHDWCGVIEADALVVFNTARSEGKAVEQGIALSRGIPIVAIGRRGEHSLNVFHFLDQYTWVPTINEAINTLKTLETSMYAQKP
jgi:hypothetical protein